MRALYPPLEPSHHGWLDVGDGHSIYFEESGNPDGKPCIFVHGGPGGGSSPGARQFFDPARYRIVLFDQRGCGRSTPHASLEANTTWDLIADMEQLRAHLGIDKWLVFGGSWGSTLSLAYAQTHPDRVTELVLRGIFLLRPEEIRWFYQEGASHIFPDYWEDYLSLIPEEERGDMVAAYYKRLTGDDEICRMHAARNWSIWEGRCATLRPSAQVVDRFSDARRAYSIARIECHYFINQAFLNPDQLLEDMSKIAHLPGIIVHGRYDMVCPLDNAFALHQRWPGSELQIIRDAGHAASEPGIADALVRATQTMARRLLQLAPQAE